MEKYKLNNYPVRTLTVINLIIKLELHSHTSFSKDNRI